MNDPYQVLGISNTATDEEVKAAYRRLAKQYHPDRNNGSAEAEKKMMQINDAYAQIMDIRKNGGRSTRSGSGQYSSSSSNGYGGYNNGYSAFGGFGDFFNRGYGYSGQAQQSAPKFATVRQYLSYGRYREALDMLNTMSDGSAEWYYLCGRARHGLGDDIAALNYAHQAANMEPNSFEYAAFVQELTRGGQQYRSQGSGYGGVVNFLCQNPCLTCMLFNLCCGGGAGMRFCCI